MTTAPATPAEVQSADVTAVLANIDQGAALRDRIKALTAELKVHEDLVKDALGAATEGVDSGGNTVIRYPHRTRSGLDSKGVKALLSDEDYAKVTRITNYRTLLYGESDK